MSTQRMVCLTSRSTSKITSTSQQFLKARLPPQERRKQLLGVASEILSKRGIEQVRIPEVARAAGVTRPVVYKFFPNRKALLVAILEDFGADLENRFREHFGRRQEQEAGLPEMVAGFVEATCDAIELKGPGAWFLMGATDSNPEIAAVAKEFLERLSGAWLTEITDATGAQTWEITALVEMVIASSRATLGLWISGKLSRAQTLHALRKGVLSLLRGFGAR